MKEANDQYRNPIMLTEGPERETYWAGFVSSFYQDDRGNEEDHVVCVCCVYV